MRVYSHHLKDFLELGYATPWPPLTQVLFAPHPHTPLDENHTMLSCHGHLLCPSIRLKHKKKKKMRSPHRRTKFKFLSMFYTVLYAMLPHCFPFHFHLPPLPTACPVSQPHQPGWTLKPDLLFHTFVSLCYSIYPEHTSPLNQLVIFHLTLKKSSRTTTSATAHSWTQGFTSPVGCLERIQAPGLTSPFLFLLQVATCQLISTPFLRQLSTSKSKSAMT